MAFMSFNFTCCWKHCPIKLAFISGGVNWINQSNNQCTNTISRIKLKILKVMSRMIIHIWYCKLFCLHSVKRIDTYHSKFYFLYRNSTMQKCHEVTFVLCSLLNMAITLQVESDTDIFSFNDVLHQNFPYLCPIKWNRLYCHAE